MSKKLKAAQARLDYLDLEDSRQSQENQAEWSRLVNKYNMPSFELDALFQSAYCLGALAEQRFQAFDKVVAARRKPFWKKLFRK